MKLPPPLISHYLTSHPHNHTMLTVLLCRQLSRSSAYIFQFTATDVSNADMLNNTLATVLTCLHGSLGQVYPDHVSLVREVQLVRAPALVATLLPGTRLPAGSAHPEHRVADADGVIPNPNIDTNYYFSIQ